ncbi:MAG: TRAP transporter substrate-binding protein DctP [Pseudomonadales bacterium]|jgi:TRAP-type C4-dicarboxylate transport system substrate-binding protein|nr:TRAP transporter substrate-binding protein DctP [Pseudomonadales bacterium]MDP6470607.1 TRAP transporter substrate-binding protein DctP [Pseudomonadales bacterium]MDP6828538.1 TRAP transporter substrate-binding protein DctP [Pseudomonadales bacterium]MDP6972024.1 TRAP transporter substrate-binding protein DctP [Pseudomonadales bacterium]
MRIFRPLCLIASLVLASLTTAQGATLKIATLSPEGSTWMRLLREAGERVERDTQGRVNFKFYPGGVMGNDLSVLRKMRLGQLHGAVVTAGGLIQHYSDIQLYNMPMVFESLEEVDFVRSRLDPMLVSGLADEGYISFGLAEVGFAYAMSKQPVASVAEVRAQKVWVPDGDEGSARALRAFGVTPIPLSIADVLGGLQTGLINSVAVPPVGAVALQWHTQLRHLTNLPLLYVYGLLTVAERPYGRLADTDQAVVRQVMEDIVGRVNARARRDHGQALEALRKQGLIFADVAEDELLKWRQQAQLAGRQLVDGGYISADLYRSLLAAISEYRSLDH